MRKLILIVVVILASCASVEGRKFNCGQDEDYSQIYMSVEESSEYKAAISRADKYFSPEKNVFWYRNTEGKVLACVLNSSWRKHQNYEFPGCFTSQYLLHREKNGSLTVVHSDDIMCT